MLPIGEKCVGCGSCAKICPKQCIEMKPDFEGFSYPVIDTTKCINCQKCEKVCPKLVSFEMASITNVYAACNLDETVRGFSSSGGVFSALAYYTISKGGVVCGAAYSDDFTVEHIIVQTKEEIDRLRGAKYTQSNLGNCFPEIKRLLKENVEVLFVGTPCQTNSLYSYLGKDYDNLLLVDMICHGVPSPKVWKSYLSQRIKSDAPDSEIESVNLRSKITGWSKYSYSVEIKYKNGEFYSSKQGQDWFMRGFTGDLYLRPSCHSCDFKGNNRRSHITLGDFWGIWELNPDFDDNKGVSLVTINGEKGKIAWDCVSNLFKTQEYDLNEALRYNPSALRCSGVHPKRSDFFKAFEGTDEVIYLIQEMLMPKQNTPSVFRRIIRRLLQKG